MPRFASSSAYPAGDHALHSSVAGALCERTGPIDWSSARRARDAPIILGRRLVGRSADDQGTPSSLVGHLRTNLLIMRITRVRGRKSYADLQIFFCYSN